MDIWIRCGSYEKSGEVTKGNIEKLKKKFHLTCLHYSISSSWIECPKFLNPLPSSGVFLSHFIDKMSKTSYTELWAAKRLQFCSYFFLWIEWDSFTIFIYIKIYMYIVIKTFCTEIQYCCLLSVERCNSNCWRFWWRGRWRHWLRWWRLWRWYNLVILFSIFFFHEFREIIKNHFTMADDEEDMLEHYLAEKSDSSTHSSRTAN